MLTGQQGGGVGDGSAGTIKPGRQLGSVWSA